MLHGDHFRITVEPVIVKRYRKTLVNKGFCKKKLDTRIDTHCIKTGVQLWQMTLIMMRWDKGVHLLEKGGFTFS